jgi:hypothetical protein
MSEMKFEAMESDSISILHIEMTITLIIAMAEAACVKLSWDGVEAEEIIQHQTLEMNYAEMEFSTIQKVTHEMTETFKTETDAAQYAL